MSNSQRSEKNCETLNANGGIGENNMAKATTLRTKSKFGKYRLGTGTRKRTGK